jgi:uncharacterized membrane protein SirB2
MVTMMMMMIIIIIITIMMIRRRKRRKEDKFTHKIYYLTSTGIYKSSKRGKHTIPRD